jgi:23S rRNA pseudouridine1911/1915/1917 synthase
VGRAAITDWKAAQFSFKPNDSARKAPNALRPDTDPNSAPATTRLDKLVADRFQLSRRAAQEAVRNGRVDLDGERCDEPGRDVAPASTIEFFPNRPQVRKVAGRLKILYEDPHVLIVDKPAGLLTQPTPDRERDTLVSRATRYLSLRHGGGKTFIGVVHRLDKDTSGALALARSPESIRAFQKLFRDHDIERQYLAVVEGSPRRESGTIDKALITDRGDLRRGVARFDGEGKHAVTHFQVIERFGPVATLVACWLETGRTHQIRIHMAAMGHPVVGEKVYRPMNQPKCKASFHRQALHAQTLGFTHPILGHAVKVEAAPPSDLDDLIVDLRNRYGIEGAGG